PDRQPIIKKGKLGITTDRVPFKAGMAESTILLKGTCTECIDSVFATTEYAQLMVTYRRTMCDFFKPVGAGLIGLDNCIVLGRIHHIVISGGVGIRSGNVLSHYGPSKQVFRQGRPVWIRTIIGAGSGRGTGGPTGIYILLIDIFPV